MVEQAEIVNADERARRAAWAGLRVISAAEAGPLVPNAAIPPESGDASGTAQQRVVRELAARLLADAWAEAQEIKRQARAAAEQIEADLAAEAAALRATLATERERHDAAMAQERERHEMAIRTLSTQRDRVIEQIAVLCRGMADAAHRAHGMTQAQSAAS
jgi:hypothetical protein